MAEANKPRTIKSGTTGKIALRLVQKGTGLYGLADGKIIVEGVDADDVWSELHEKCGRSSSRYFGYSGARRKFLEFFPGGFVSSAYVDHEREYKVEAKRRLDITAPLEMALNDDGLAEAILSVYRATNLLSPFEQTRMQAVLRSDRADAFIRAAAEFTLEPTRQSLQTMEMVLKHDDNAKWTVVTYLPFLWQPERHMFLKPMVTVDYAERVGHPFARDYQPRLDLVTYRSLQDLASSTEAELADLQPKDRIDVQSFIWVIGGAYDGEPVRA